ncbi:histidine kinase 1 isoform X2 [Magnolia sinica]|uniref:histidine kinase 1 isoform X2 n=1 Tax=Magnolia sinica TaxID=86752 RepID=UPI00265B1E55|nr:histidine kinase 1 isoform X2 [Magnolia sinica]
MAVRSPLSVTFESPKSISTMPTSRWRRFLDGFRSFITWSNNPTSSTPCRRRILHGEDEEQEFQLSNTHCLSSYYSVFVARLAIMVMLAILIGMLTILTWHFTRVYTTKSLNILAYDLRFELLQRPILRMWNILNSTVEITMAQVKLSEFVISHYGKPVADTQPELYEVMKNLTWALFASRKALNSITISYKNGFVQAFHRDHRSNNTFYIYSDLANSSVSGTQKSWPLASDHGWQDKSGDGNISAIWYREPLHPITGEKTGDAKQIPPDDLINIAGLSELHDGGASWHVAVSKFTDSPLLSAALPVHHPSDRSITAVVGVTTALFSVGQLMRELVEYNSGYMYLTSQEGYVLATSTDSPLLRNSTSGPKLMMAIDSEDHIIRSGAEWLQKAYGNKLSLNQEVHAENVMLRNQRYYIDSFFLNLKRLPLVGVIIIPRKYIMGKVDQRGFTTLVILISASVCILVVGCFCIMILTSGVSKEMKLRAELISHLDARRRAEQSSNYKSQFLANMSHELRTPMAAVIGLLDILICDDCLTNEQFATVTQIRKCSTALLRLLNNILDLSKVESGKLVLEEAEFDLGRELEGLVDMFSVQCINHNVETVLDLSDDIPRLVRGDSARVVQIFANLISNSIKFTTTGHIILRGWCESSNAFSNTEKLYLDQKEPRPALKAKSKQHGSIAKGALKKDNKITLWFEVDDTGCGIDPNKWESVFESFEQADPSTTRTHGGTGLGLCIVRTLVNKMSGEIKVVKKEGPGTLMQLYLVLNTTVDGTGQHCQIEFGEHSLMVLLALNGSTGRCIMSKWLRKKGVCTREASEWNELTQILQEVFQGRRIVEYGFANECSTSEPLRANQMRFAPKEANPQNTRTSNIIIVVDIGLLDLSTNIWREQLNFLDKYHEKAKFAWILNHDTSNAIKIELRRKGHLLMVNKPLYKAKMVQILEAIVRERSLELQTKNNTSGTEDLHECLEIDHVHLDVASSDDSDTTDIGISNLRRIDACLRGEDKDQTILISNPRHYRIVNSGKEITTCKTNLNNVPQNPNILLRSENVENSEDFHFESRGHDKIIKENNASKSPELSEEMQPQPAKSSPMKSNNCPLEFTGESLKEEKNLKPEYPFQIGPSSDIEESNFKLPNEKEASTSCELRAKRKTKHPGKKRLAEPPCGSLKLNEYQESSGSPSEQDCIASRKANPSQNSLEGLCVLLAEDTPVLQRVATIMLEKMGAIVVAVGDGLQAVDALKCTLSEECRRQNTPQQDGEIRSQTKFHEMPPFDLILMDCQMPKMDGYEATKEIRRYEAGTSSHIPIVALTAHAMSSDEAKCLEVGMDAYLTKPIDCKLMVSTILSLTKRMA